MSGVFKSVKKAFKKLKESKILKVVVIAAAVWFTAGAASAYFAAPSVGLGGAMSASASSMWATATTGTYVSASSVAITNATAAANAVTVGAAAGAGAGAQVGTAISATEGAGALSASEAALATGEAALTEASIAGTMPAAANTGIVAGAAGGGAPAAGGSWFAQNPMATMMLGQAGAGAVSSYEARKDADAQREEDARIRRERGLMGVDYTGEYKGAPTGIVASQQVVPQQTTAQATAAPTVAPVARPVTRKNLPELQKQGLVAPQQVA